MNNYLILLLIWNIVVMFVYGIDKFCAKNGRRRVSEKCLLICALIFGSLGAMLGMVLFNHKTSKLKFRLLVPILFVTEFAILCWLYKYLN